MFDASENDGSYGHIINFCKKHKNVKPIFLSNGENVIVAFKTLCNIEKDEQILWNYDHEYYITMSCACIEKDVERNSLNRLRNNLFCNMLLLCKTV